MDEIEKLAEEILEYQADVDWYGLCDDYGNINTDSEAREHALEEIVSTLQNSPEDIVAVLNENITELEFDENYEENEIYKKSKELIEKIESL